MSEDGAKNVICTISNKIYTESIRKLHDQYNKAASDKISLSVFYSLKTCYYMPASKNEKQSCLCINCLNTQVLLKPINGCRSSMKLPPYKSCTTRILIK